MITVTEATKAPAEIARLVKLNNEAADRIVAYMADAANFKQVRNARLGMIARDERIAELRALV